MAKVKGIRSTHPYAKGMKMTLKENHYARQRTIYKRLFIASTIINVILLLTTIIR